MLEVILIDGRTIGVNQKHICSFSKKILEDQNYTELRMSNGDVWIVVDPSWQAWFPDICTTSTEY